MESQLLVQSLNNNENNHAYQQQFRLARKLKRLLSVLLREHEITVGITLRRPLGGGAVLPPPVILGLLASSLSQLDCYSIPRHHAVLPQAKPAAYPSAITQEHALSLKKCSASLTTCAISIFDNVPPDIGLDVIASFVNLTKLHLTIGTLLDDTSLLQHLATIACLEDLALQCENSGCCCKGLLVSSRNSLRSVDLSAGSWTTQTYKSLQGILHLDFLGVYVRELDCQAACELAGISAGSFCLSLPALACTAEAISILRSHKAQIHELTIWRPWDKMMQHLHLPCLRRLTLFTSGMDGFTGTTLQTHPKLHQLVLVGVSASNVSGLLYVVTQALPALTELRISAAQHDLSWPVPQVQEVLHVLPQGHHLKLIDLRGLQGLTDTHLSALRHAFHLRQETGLAQPCVTLLLPSPLLGQAQATVQYINEACCERLCTLKIASHDVNFVL